MKGHCHHPLVRLACSRGKSLLDGNLAFNNVVHPHSKGDMSSPSPLQNKEKKHQQEKGEKTKRREVVMYSPLLKFPPLHEQSQYFAFSSSPTLPHTLPNNATQLFLSFFPATLLTITLSSLRVRICVSSR